MTIICVAAASAVAGQPALESHDVGPLHVQTPRGWAFSGDADKGVMLAQQDPKRKDAAQMFVVVMRQNAPGEDKLIDTVIGQAKDVKIVRRGTAPGGAGKLVVADGSVDGIAVRMGVIAIAANGGAVTGALLAKASDFDDLGGTDLVVAVMSSLSASGGSSSSSDAPAQAMPAGKYACMTLRYTVNSPPTYVPAGITFELDGKGGYSASSFTGGPGAVSFDGNVMSFTGGALDTWHGYTGSTDSGPFVRIRMKDPTTIARSLELGDAMCYLQK